MDAKMELYVFVFMCLGLGHLSSSQECSIEPADMVFVLDTSYSIWPPDFYREVDFVEKVIPTFNVGPGPRQTRMSVMTYGHRVWPKFYLNTYTDVTKMLRAVKNIRYGEGKTTNTGDALSYTQRTILSTRAGAREDSTKIVLVISDGRSQKTWFTQQVAKAMQDEGIHLFAISIGFRLDHTELAGIASDPDDQYFFNIDQYSDMTYIKRTLEAMICEKLNTNNDTAQDLKDDNTAEFKAGKEEVLVLNCTDKAADIYFVLDASYSINTENFAKEMEFVYGVVDILDVGENKTRVGIMTFSDEARFHVRLEHALSKVELVTFANTAKYIGGGTDTANALRNLRETGFYGPDVEQRTDAVKVVIILTDGLSISPDTTAREAALLKNLGVHIFAIGIGYGVDKKELMDMASEPADEYLVNVDDFGSLVGIKMMLAGRTCSTRPWAESTPYGLNIPGVFGDQAVCHPFRDTDLLFIYDTMALESWRSHSISQFIADAVSSFNLATDRLRVGRVTENCPQGDIPLGSALKSKDLDAVKFQAFTDLLKRVQRTGFSVENGGREGAKKMAVIFVDPIQQFGFDTLVEARKLKESVDFFYIVAIGENMYTPRFIDLAGEDMTLQVGNYVELAKVSDSLMSAICDSFFQ